MILQGCRNPHGSVELKRIVLQPEGPGLRPRLRSAAGADGVSRPAARTASGSTSRALNARALALYRSEGFVEEGRLRESVRSDGGYDSLIVMSLLEREYDALVAAANATPPARPESDKETRMRSTMMDVPLSLNHLLDRAGTLFARQRDRLAPARQVAAQRTPTASTTGAPARSPSALQKLGLKKGDRVATLSWNHHAHLECYFGIPAAGGVMHTLNLRLAPDEIGWIAADAAGPLPRRRRHPAAAVPPVRRTCMRSRR